MEKIILAVVVVFVLAGITESSEYRNFKNQEGKEVCARIVQYDAKGERVQLELKNHNKAWIELSTLSEADQTYIRNMNTFQAKSDEQKNETVTKKQVKEIAEKYIEAVMDKDYETWAALMADATDFDKRRFNASYTWRSNSPYNLTCLVRLKKIKYKSQEENYVRVLVKQENRESEHWLMFQPDGKIKYDSIFILHPVQVVRACTGYFWSPLSSKRDASEKQVYSDTLIKMGEMGLPLFGYTPDVSESHRIQSIRKIFDWLQKHGDEWDVSEPKVFYPGEILNFKEF